MNRGSPMGSVKTAMAILMASLFQRPAPAATAPVASEQAACALTKARVVARDHFPVSVIAFCDFIVPEAQPKGFYVLALHSARKCDGICSTNMGWFAVQKATRRVFEWDMVEEKLGPPVRIRP